MPVIIMSDNTTNHSTLWVSVYLSSARVPSEFQDNDNEKGTEVLRECWSLSIGSAMAYNPRNNSIVQLLFVNITFILIADEMTIEMKWIFKLLILFSLSSSSMFYNGNDLMVWQTT